MGACSFPYCDMAKPTCSVKCAWHRHQQRTDPTTEAMTATIRALLAQLEGQPVKHPQQAAERELARWLTAPAKIDSEDQKEGA